MAILRRNYNHLDRSYFEHADPHSVTVPDQSLSIAEIFDRMRRGMSLEDLSRGGYYDDPDAFAEDLDTADDGFVDYTDYPTGYEVSD